MYEMTEGTKKFFRVLTALGITFFMLMCAYFGLEKQTYRRAQIDYYNGKIQWVLEKQEDSSIIWVNKTPQQVKESDPNAAKKE